MTLPLTSTQSIPDSVEKHSTCPSVRRARFESRRRSPGDRSMCFSSIDGKAPRSPVIKTDCQTAIKVMDLPVATSMSWHSGQQTIHTQVDTRHIFSLWSREGSSGYQAPPWSMSNKTEYCPFQKHKCVSFKQRFHLLFSSGIHSTCVCRLFDSVISASPHSKKNLNRKVNFPVHALFCVSSTKKDFNHIEIHRTYCWVMPCYCLLWCILGNRPLSDHNNDTIQL